MTRAFVARTRLLSTAFLMAGCVTAAQKPCPAHGDVPGAHELAAPQTALSFLAQANQLLRESWEETERVAWINETYITEDTDWLAARTTERSMALLRRLTARAAHYGKFDLPYDATRQLRLLQVSANLPAPAEPALRRELAEIGTYLSSTYGKGKACIKGYPGCLDLGQLSRILAEDRNYDKLLLAWRGWREVSAPMRDPYLRFVELQNAGARLLGFRDAGELWRSRYDMPAEAFEAEAERLWKQVRPLYQALHCYVRRRLSEAYGEHRVPRTGPIPAHVLGNMWAQEWSNIYPIVKPYPDEIGPDVTANLTAHGWDAERMVRAAEAFFTSLGLSPLPQTFWERSMFTRPRDREVVCHASAWDMGGTPDVRIKMCIDSTEEDLYTIHHELGHNYYFMHYTNLPALYQRGAHDGFHEGIGDTLALSVTPPYLKRLGLLNGVGNTEKAELNTLMKRALDKVAFLPFGKLVDHWRWEVFDGRIKPDELNAVWWRLREQYQGVVAPIARTEEHFDPGAKYHIPANVPYVRYFLAHILQFQFHRALCQAAHQNGPLHKCSIYGSKEAGAKLAAMMRLGQSKPWPEALAILSGERDMDATALLEYFEPLRAYLAEANKNEKCGW